MHQRHRISEFAELTGVTVKALQHYDRLGLLTPARTDSGHRVYATRDLERVEQIVALRTPRRRSNVERYRTRSS